LFIGLHCDKFVDTKTFQKQANHDNVSIIEVVTINQLEVTHSGSSAVEGVNRWQVVQVDEP